MAAKAVWEIEGLNNSATAIEKVMRDFREHGTKDMKSTEMLKKWLDGAMMLSEETLIEMYNEDPEEVLEMLYNCYGLREAYEIYRKIPQETEDFHKAKEMEGRLDHTREELKICCERMRSANEKCDRLDEENIRLKNESVQLKAKLYDAAAAGFDVNQIFSEFE